MFPTFYRHCTAEYLKQHFLVTGVLATIVVLVDFSALSNRTALVADTTVLHALIVAAARLPFFLGEITFLTSFIAGLLTFSALTTSQEALILRATGTSGWRFVGLIGATAGATSLLFAVAGSGLVAWSTRQAVSIEGERFGRISEISIFSAKTPNSWASKEILWEGEPTLVSVQIDKFNANTDSFSDVRIDFKDSSDLYTRWIKASQGRVVDGGLLLKDVTSIHFGESPTELEELFLAVPLDSPLLGATSIAPNSLGILGLFDHIQLSAQAGLAAVNFRLRLMQLLALPFLAFGAVLLSSFFALRSPRHGNRGLWMVGGFVLAGNLFFTHNMSLAFGTLSLMHAYLVVWILPTIMILSGILLLSFLEDG